MSTSTTSRSGLRRVAQGAAGAVIAGGIVFGGVAVATAEPATDTGSSATSESGTTDSSAPAAGTECEPGSMKGHGPGGHGPGAGETELTGADAEQATAAAQAAVPDGTVMRVETDADGVYEAHVRSADGTPVTVKLDESFTVTEIVDGPGPMGPGAGKPGGHGPGMGGQDGSQADSGDDASDAPTSD